MQTLPKMRAVFKKYKATTGWRGLDAPEAIESFLDYCDRHDPEISKQRNENGLDPLNHAAKRLSDMEMMLEKAATLSDHAHSSKPRMLAGITTENVDLYLDEHGLSDADASTRQKAYRAVHAVSGNWIAEELDSSLSAALDDLIDEYKRTPRRALVDDPMLETQADHAILFKDGTMIVKAGEADQTDVNEHGSVTNTYGLTWAGYGPGWASDSSCRSLKTVEIRDRWTVQPDASGMFNGCESLSTITGLENLDTGNVTDMSWMFNGCESLSTITGLENWDTGSVASVSDMFGYCRNLAALDLSNWNTANVADTSYMFYDCETLTAVEGLSGWNTANVTDTSYMFSYCEALAALDLSGWDTGNVTDAHCMFYDCRSLSTITGLENWDTGNVTEMECMFNYCLNLAALDLSGWDMSRATDTSYMFDNCPAKDPFKTTKAVKAPPQKMQPRPSLEESIAQAVQASRFTTNEQACKKPAKAQER